MVKSKTPDKEDSCTAYPRVVIWKRPFYRWNSKWRVQHNRRDTEVSKNMMKLRVAGRLRRKRRCKTPPTRRCDWVLISDSPWLGLANDLQTWDFKWDVWICVYTRCKSLWRGKLRNMWCRSFHLWTGKMLLVCRQHKARQRHPSTESLPVVHVEKGSMS